MTLESTISKYEFMSDLDGMDEFINEEVLSLEGKYFFKEPYQRLPDSTEMDNVVDQENSVKAVDTYDQFFGDEVCIPDEQGEKICPESRSVRRKTRVTLEGLDILHCLQITLYIRFHLPMYKWKS